MGDKSNIEWTDATWNPVRGCALVSAGCTNCYAMRQARRSSGKGGAYEGLTKLTSHGPVWTGAVALHPELLRVPYYWARGRRIFVNSMSDLFHEDVPFEFIASVFAIMGVTTRHTYQILTKRPQRMLDFFAWAHGEWEPTDFLADERIFDHFPKDLPWQGQDDAGKRGGYDNCGPLYPYPNVWLGVSVEDQATADERIPLLLDTPAAIRFLSCEPLLGPIDLTSLPIPPDALLPSYGTSHGFRFDALRNNDERMHQSKAHIDWIIAGGESGPRARPSRPDWFQSLRDQCRVADVPFFFKQWGEWYPWCEPEQLCGDRNKLPRGLVYFPGPHYIFEHRGKRAAGNLLDGRTH